MNFKVGQKVVCVMNFNPRNPKYFRTGNRMPVKGEIYTVRELVDDDAIRLVEIVNPICDFDEGAGELAYYNSAFRPIDYSVGEKVCEYITKECEKSKTPETV